MKQRRWVALAAAALLSLLCAHGALAQSAPTLSVTPMSASPGDPITISGAGWDADEDVTIEGRLGSNVLSTDTARAGLDGRFSGTSQIPAGFPPGVTITLVATGGSSGKTARAQLSVVARAGVPTPTPAPVAAVPPDETAPHCQAGEEPQFLFGFALLKGMLGAIMGEPVECMHYDPLGTGDTHQQTTTGLGFYRAVTNTPTFTDGYRHWASTPAGLLYWVGDAIDPPAAAVIVPPPTAPATPPTPASGPAAVPPAAAPPPVGAPPAFSPVGLPPPIIAPPALPSPPAIVVPPPLFPPRR
jgi:hypothetical protein